MTEKQWILVGLTLLCITALIVLPMTTSESTLLVIVYLGAAYAVRSSR